MAAHRTESWTFVSDTLMEFESLQQEHKRRVAVFANVTFEQYGNQSVKNFVEGLLLHGCRVTLFTVARTASEVMDRFVEEHSDFDVVSLLGIDDTSAAISFNQSRSKKLRQFIKRKLSYRRYLSNSEVNQWASAANTFAVLRKVAAKLREDLEWSEFDKCIFIDEFGGMLARYLYATEPSLRFVIADRGAGYFLGTILHQFGTARARAFLAMPLSLLGSDHLPYRKLIITDDGTNGEEVFRNMLDYKGDILFVRNGIDDRLIRYEGRKEQSDFHQLRFVTCSRLVSWKRIDRAIGFCHYLASSIDIDLHLSIIGDGPERENLERLVDALSMRRHVTFLGALDYDRSMASIQENDFYIVFNDLSTMGNQVNESIVLGLILITIDDGTTDTLLQDGFNAIKFPMRDNFELMAAQEFVANYLGDKSRLDMLRENILSARKRVFSWRERNKMEYGFLFNSDNIA